MGFIKVVKNKAYFKRYQVKFRRRREAKTDYYARQRLILQDKNKYQSPKFRLVVRFSNRDICCQVVAADMTHDRVVACAYAHELPRYGITFGLTNYAAAYATGLLLARRINKKFGLDYDGEEEVTGELSFVEGDGSGKAPFKVLLDVGLRRTTTGSKVFGAMKGASDGGLNVPHNARRFPGSVRDKESGEWEFNADKHRSYIFGGHVKEYMEKLQEKNKDLYKQRFGKYIKLGITPGKIEGLYKAAHAKIRKDPLIKRNPLSVGRFGKRTRKQPACKPKVQKRFNRKKTSLQQRRGRIKQKLLAQGKKSLAAPATAAAAATTTKKTASEEI